MDAKYSRSAPSGSSAFGAPKAPWEEPHKYAGSSGFHFGGYYDPLGHRGHTWWQEAISSYSKEHGHLPGNVAAHQLSQELRTGTLQPGVQSLREQYYSTVGHSPRSRSPRASLGGMQTGGIGSGMQAGGLQSSGMAIPYVSP